METYISKWIEKIPKRLCGQGDNTKVELLKGNFNFFIIVLMEIYIKLNLHN